MPRGLGEDPLRRQKKATKRSFAHSVHVTGSGELSSGGQPNRPDSQNGTMVAVSTSRPPSYNDVFFRKRSESTAIARGTDYEHPAAPPAVSAPVGAEQAALVPPEVEFVVPGPLEAPPALETAVVEPDNAPEAVPTDDLNEAEAVAPDSQPAPSAAEIAQSPQAARADTKPSSQEPHEGGLLKRIFGRFRK